MQPEYEPAEGIELANHEFVGRGPDCGSGGWSRSEGLIYRCAMCGTPMPAQHRGDFICECGAMLLDFDAGRFGSRHGDQNILVYKRKSANRRGRQGID